MVSCPLLVSCYVTRHDRALRHAPRDPPRGQGPPAAQLVQLRRGRHRDRDHAPPQPAGDPALGHPPGHPGGRPPHRSHHVAARHPALLAGGDRAHGRARPLPSRGRSRDGARGRQGRHAPVPERRHRPWVADLLARVEASGYLSVCLTVDVQVYSRRERDIVARFTPREAMLKAPNPRPPDPEYPARLTWADVDWLRKTTKLPIGLKGIMTARDARRAVEAGVELIWVSNHGGRQLDATQASIDALPAVREAVGGDASIIVDGGFARGTDVLKGVARGADAVAIGRTALWGLAADGAAGVACSLDILRRELRTSMALAGQTSVRGLTPDVVFRVD